eukprot:m.257291 g.257291  ORF g.257291 m.257291 type:complete len:581 (+) comp35152_c0_seq1:253-1995(+)
MSDDALYPIAVLIEELKNEDVQIRLNSIKRLSTIALALGDSRTRSELIPFLNEALDDEDEVLLAISAELSKFVPLVGGSEFAHKILPPLEKLAMVEESVVHDKAVEALCTIGAQQSAAHLEEFMLPLIQRLSSDIGWASRVSACGLFTIVYGKIEAAAQTTIKTLFTKLCSDDMPMVRRAAATHIGTLASKLTADLVKTDLIPLFKKLIVDEQDNVRPIVVKASVDFAKRLSKEDVTTLLVPLLHAASKDRSWRVRFVVADIYAQLQSAMGSELSRSELAPMLVRLLRDQEKEVRMAAVEQLPQVCIDLPQIDRATMYTTNFLPYIPDLAADASQYVRIKVAAVLVTLTPVIGKEKSLELIVPLYVKLLKDEVADVRMSVIPSLSALNNVVGSDSIKDDIIPEIVSLAQDPQWRVRLAVTEQMPGLAKALGQSTFDTHLTQVVLTWLEDAVYAIRYSTSICINELVKIFGENWSKKSLKPLMQSMATSDEYLKRLTSLFLCKQCSESLDKDMVNSVVVPLVLKLCKDGVPNVRFNATQVLGAIAPKVDKNCKTVKPMLEELSKDTDVDVRFYANAALAAY